MTAKTDNHFPNQIRCEHCGHLSSFESRICPRCGVKIHFRKPDSIQRTLAFLITAMILYIPAMILPVMTTFQFGEPNPSTIIGGVAIFLHHGDYLVASIIFLASVVIPLVKIFALTYLCFCVLARFQSRPIHKTRLFQIAEALGKWSMIDVFVVIVLVNLVRVDNLMYIQSGSGILAFAGVVINTMLAAESFDTRLIWDASTT